MYKRQVMFSFIACIILLCKAFGGVIFEVQTYINSKREVEVSPRGTRIFFCQPCRDGVGRRPDNDRDMVACSRLKHFVEMLSLIHI